MKRKILLIINPIAGHGLAPKIEGHIKQSGLQDDFNVEVVHTQSRGHAIKLSKEAAEKGYHIVIAAGGDGTVNEVASSLVNSSTALAIIPAGSGNGLARHLQIPLKPLEALIKIKQGNNDSIDTLSINNRFAVNVSGFGFDGYVAWLFDKHPSRGLMTYTSIALKNYFKYPAVDFKFSLDGTQYDANAHMLVIANASQFGNAAIIAPKADLKDGKADIILVKRPPIHKMPETFYRLFNGTLKSNNYTKMFSGKELNITASRPVHLHIDGEPHEPITKVNVIVNSKSLKVIS